MRRGDLGALLNCAKWTMIATSDFQVITMPEILRRRAVTDPDRRFLVDVAGKSASYGAAATRSATWATSLAELGVGPGTTVATFGHNSLEATCLWFGLTSLRAWEVPIHPAYRGYMLEYSINNVHAETLVVSVEFLDRLIESRGALEGIRTVIVTGTDVIPDNMGFERVFCADELLSQVASQVELELPNPWDLAGVLYTSGTTGPSKGVMVPWAQLAAMAVRLFPWEDLNEDDVFYCFTPASHIGAKVLPYMAALLNGAMVIRKEFKTDEFLMDVKRYGVTTVGSMSVMTDFLMQLPATPDDKDLPLRIVIMTPVTSEVDAFRERFGVRVCTSYNSTELCAPFASEGWNTANQQSVGKLKSGYPGVEVRIVDVNDNPVPVGGVGELIVRTSEPWTLNAGYFGVPEAAAEVWRNGWFHTGDAFRCDDDGYFYFVDRLRDTIRRRGENISSFEVEAVANEHVAIAESAAVAVPADM